MFLHEVFVHITLASHTLEHFWSVWIFKSYLSRREKEKVDIKISVLSVGIGLLFLFIAALSTFSLGHLLAS